MSTSLSRRVVALAARVNGLVQLKAQDLGTTYEERYGCGILAAKERVPSKVYPSLDIYAHPSAIDLPEEGKASIDFTVTRRSIDERDGRKRHGYTLKIKSIDPVPEKKPGKKKLPGSAKILSALEPRMICLARDRNQDGEFASNDGGAVTPDQAAAAYGPGTIARSAQTAAASAGDPPDLAAIAGKVKRMRVRP